MITDKSFSKITRTIKIASYQWRQDQKFISRIKKTHEFLNKDFHTAYWDDCVKESDHWKNNLLYLRKKIKQWLFQYTLYDVNDKHIIIKNTEYTTMEIFGSGIYHTVFTSWIEYTMQSIPIPINLNMKNILILSLRTEA